jgi:formiminotetrahydrofolate cyclodeaminase
MSVLEGRMIQSVGEEFSAVFKVFDPTDNRTGGGTASALAGAMAAALVAMVARLSIGTDKMENEGDYSNIEDECTMLSRRLLAGGRKDSQAFERVLASHRLPGKTERQRRHRQAAIQEALAGAARVPLANGEACKRILDLCLRLLGHCNPNTVSDLECAWHLARAGLLGCLANVEINVLSIEDQKLKAELAERVQTLREDVRVNETHWSS